MSDLYDLDDDFDREEFADLVYESFEHTGVSPERPMTPGLLTALMSARLEHVFRVPDVRRALERLVETGWIERRPGGYVSLGRRKGLVRQMSLEEVEPFTSEPQERLEAHRDGVWSLPLELDDSLGTMTPTVVPHDVLLQTEKKWEGYEKLPWGSRFR